MTTSAPIIPASFDPFLSENLDDPYPLYRKLRDRGPVTYLEGRNLYIVCQYEAMDQVLRDYRTFVSCMGTSYMPVAESGYRYPFVDNDPPKHTQVRRSAQRWFSTDAIADLQPKMSAYVDQMLAETLLRSEIDVMTAIAKPLPIHIINSMMGIEPPSQAKMYEWVDAIFHMIGPEPEQKFTALTMEGLNWLVEKGIAAMPAHCLGRALIDKGGDEGALVEHRERLLALYTLWMAGVDTTYSTIGNAVHAFATHPEQWDAIVADPSLVESAVEEVLRWDSPLRMFMRRTLEPAELGGVEIPAGANMLMLFPAANRDERHFPEADLFDVRRSPNDHLAFGAGIHLCIGAAVARTQVAVLFRALAERVRSFELAGTPVRNPSRVVRGFHSLPVRIVPR
jgi:cytochrome P450